MITNFIKYLESNNYKLTGVVNIKIDNKDTAVHLGYKTKQTGGSEVALFIGDEKYFDLSIKIPDSDELNSSEFYLEPNINPEIIEQLVKLGLITKTDVTAVAGDKKAIKYYLNV